MNVDQNLTNPSPSNISGIILELFFVSSTWFLSRVSQDMSGLQDDKSVYF